MTTYMGQGVREQKYRTSWDTGNLAEKYQGPCYLVAHVPAFTQYLFLSTTEGPLKVIIPVHIAVLGVAVGTGVRVANQSRCFSYELVTIVGIRKYCGDFDLLNLFVRTINRFHRVG